MTFIWTLGYLRLRGYTDVSQLHERWLRADGWCVDEVKVPDVHIAVTCTSCSEYPFGWIPLWEENFTLMLVQNENAGSIRLKRKLNWRKRVSVVLYLVWEWEDTYRAHLNVCSRHRECCLTVDVLCWWGVRHLSWLKLVFLEVKRVYKVNWLKSCPP